MNRFKISLLTHQFFSVIFSISSVKVVSSAWIYKITLVITVPPCQFNVHKHMLCWAEQLEFSTLIGVNCHARIPNWLTTFTLLIEKITLKNRRVNTLILNRFKRTPLGSFYWVWFYFLIVGESILVVFNYVPWNWNSFPIEYQLELWVLSFEFQLNKRSQKIKTECLLSKGLISSW